MNSTEQKWADILRSFHQGVACAKYGVELGEIEAFEIYDSALNFAANDFGVKKSYVDELVTIHYTNRGGFPNAW